MPTALTSRLTSALAVTAAAASLLLGGAAAAAAAPGAGGMTPYYSACNVHLLPDGRGAEVCRTWIPNGDGTYHGTWEVVRTNVNITAQGRFDGKVRDLGAQGTYARARDFVTRVCDGKRCSSWA